MLAPEASSHTTGAAVAFVPNPEPVIVPVPLCVQVPLAPETAGCAAASAQSVSSKRAWPAAVRKALYMDVLVGLDGPGSKDRTIAIRGVDGEKQRKKADADVTIVRAFCAKLNRVCVPHRPAVPINPCSRHPSIRLCADAR